MLLLFLLFGMVVAELPCGDTYDWCREQMGKTDNLWTVIMMFYNNITERNACSDIYEICKNAN